MKHNRIIGIISIGLIELQTFVLKTHYDLVKRSV